MGLSPDCAIRTRARSIDAVTEPYRRCPSTDAVQRAEYADLKVYMPNDPLVKVDRMSMAHSLEVRCPLLDRRVVELAFRIPASRKQVGRQGKALLRALARRRLAGRAVAASEARLHGADRRVDRRTARRDVPRRSARIGGWRSDPSRRERSSAPLRRPSKRTPGPWLCPVGGLGARTVAANVRGVRVTTNIRRALVVVVLVGAASVGLREVVNSSTFQLFGDYVASVDTDEKVVALTFDDGPHPQYTLTVLDILDRHNIKATFFMMGRNVERFPAVAREVLARGHEVGNHSYSHPKLIFMWPSEVRDEIERTDALLRGIGVSGQIHFRPPHASKFIVLPYVLKQMGKLSVMGDVDPEEWKRRPAAVMTDSILRQTRPGSIIGLHDVMGVETIKTLEAIVPALVARGYRFERVSEFVRRRRS